ncbi:AI-2E family transporter [Gulbenkiania mobilis]|uniref:AI-2E family transporter n=1 Tax=Gulbenkiania mobilis TaxID=397457 RepID=UPI0009F81BFC|nr:AI-2E family transporter [Gulbenkiania mobilis]
MPFHPLTRRVLRRSALQVLMLCIGVMLLALLWQAASVLLVLFCGVLLALFLSGLASWLSSRTGLGYGWALTAVLVGLAGSAVAALLALAPSVSEQMGELWSRMPQLLRGLVAQMEHYPWLDGVRQRLASLTGAAPAASGGTPALPTGQALSTAASMFSVTLGGLVNLVVILALGLYLAVSPTLYLRGLMHLVPPAHRTRTQEVLAALGSTLRQWLAAQLMAMAVIGSLTTLGLWLLDVELALALGLFTGVLTFVPTIGPVISAIPPVLLGLAEGPDKALYVLAMYLGVQAIEEYLVTPMLQKRMVSLAPAVTIAAQFLMGVLAGPMGIVVAAPLAASVLVLVRMLYVEGALGDATGASPAPPAP